MTRYLVWVSGNVSTKAIIRSKSKTKQMAEKLAANYKKHFPNAIIEIKKEKE